MPNIQSNGGDRRLLGEVYGLSFDVDAPSSAGMIKGSTPFDLSPRYPPSLLSSSSILLHYRLLEIV